jgi:hypothetical protein
MNARRVGRGWREWLRTLGWAALLAGGAPLGALAQTVDWLQLPVGCRTGSITAAEGEKPQVVACGNLGSFVFGRSGLHYDGPCTTVGASEVPSPIPVEPAPRLPAAFPCAGGRCLGRSAGRPWVAILDWPTAHGWSVAATIREASDQRLDVQLYDLTATGALGQWVPSVSDLQVLYQLCALAAAPPGERPLAVNMSFGRHRTGEADCRTAGPSLGCAVSQVLSQLAAEGILPVAAAGNHREMLFPAASPNVVSAGALDLAEYQVRQESRPSSQTPSAAGALMLGYGVYLSTPAGNGGAPIWPAPPGSSYAAALFTGWFGGTLAGGGKLAVPFQEPGDRWTPVITGKGFALAWNGVPLPGSELLDGPQLLLARALGEAPVARAQHSDVTLRLTGPAGPIPELPVLYADAGNGPLPGVDPCVPCHGNGEIQGAPGGDTVLVDLSASGGLPSQMEPRSLWLRVGSAFYGFDRSYDAGLLATLAAGGFGSLALSGVSGIFPAGEQPSLVLVVRVGGMDYWHEVPIQLLP